jgi:uncharacterized membrane protein YhiD involved in acid resistance
MELFGGVSKELSSAMDSFAHINYASLLLKIAVSTLCGALLAFHYTLIPKIKTKKKAMAVAKSQVLICMAVTIMILIIDGNTARAIGVFGMGAFIRFRSPVRNPLDASIMFVLAGIGMGVGVGFYSGSILLTVFVYIVISVLDIFKISKIDTAEAKDDADDWGTENDGA